MEHHSTPDFDEDLRQVLRRSGCRDEKIGCILEESNAMDSRFLERVNTLRANSECKKGAQRQGLMLDTHEEFYKWFTQQARKNLQVGREFTTEMDLDQPSYQAPDCPPVACPTVSLSPNHRDVVVNVMGSVHQSL